MSASSDEGFNGLLFDDDDEVSSPLNDDSRLTKGTSQNYADEDYGENDFEPDSPLKTASSHSESARQQDRPESIVPAATEAKEDATMTANSDPCNAGTHSISATDFQEGQDNGYRRYSGRERLEHILSTLHDRASTTLHSYTTTFRNETREHKVILNEGSTYRPTSPYSLDMNHARVADYRTFRPTSSDRTIRPSKPRSRSAKIPVGVDFDAQELRKSVEKASRRSLAKIESMDTRWNKRLYDILDGKLRKLRNMHKAEMAKLYADFNSYNDNERLLNSTLEKNTLEQQDFVDHHTAVQRMNNHSRREKLTSLVRNRQNDEIKELKGCMRAPLEILKRTTDAQVEVISKLEEKVHRCLDHIQRMIDVVKPVTNPSIRNRSQQAELKNLNIVHWAIDSIEDIYDNCSTLYDEAFIDHDEEARKRVIELNQRSHAGTADLQNKTSGLDAQDLVYKEHSSPYTRKCYYREVGGCRFRTQSPPKGSTAHFHDIPGEERRPHPASMLRGKILRGPQDILNEKNDIPYRVTQFGKSSRTKKQRAAFPEVSRPSTAPSMPTTNRKQSNQSEPNQTKASTKQRPRTAASPSITKAEAKAETPKSQTTGGAAWDPHIFPANDAYDDSSVDIMNKQEKNGEPPYLSADDDADLEVQKARKRQFLKSSVDSREQGKRDKVERMLAKHAPKVRKLKEKNEIRCSQCDREYPIEETIFTPKYGVHPTLQAQFRARQAAAQRKYIQYKDEQLSASEKMTRKLIRDMKKVKKAFGVAPKKPDQFCSWVCCKIHTLRNCHPNMRYDMDTLITLTAGRPIDTGTK